jgi:hypothetical protein
MLHSFLFSTIILDVINASDRGILFQVQKVMTRTKYFISMFNVLLTVLQYDFFIFWMALISFEICVRCGRLAAKAIKEING